MVSDARYNTKVWIDTYFNLSNVSKDSGCLGVQVMYENPNYPMELEFKAPSVVDVIVTIGQPNSTAEPSGDQIIRRYHERVPIKFFAVNKTGVTGVKAIWQVEAELRRIAETYPEGSQRTFNNRRPATQILGSTTVYGSEWELDYWRGVN